MEGALQNDSSDVGMLVGETLVKATIFWAASRMSRAAFAFIILTQNSLRSKIKSSSTGADQFAPEAHLIFPIHESANAPPCQGTECRIEWRS